MYNTERYVQLLLAAVTSDSRGLDWVPQRGGSVWGSGRTSGAAWSTCQGEVGSAVDCKSKT